MSVVIGSNLVDTYADDWIFNVTVSSDESNQPDEQLWPYPVQGSVLAQYRQKCLDLITGLWTAWTTDYLDVYGSEYPGAGFSFATYRVITITYDRAVP
jgi:hypothetical protein